MSVFLFSAGFVGLALALAHWTPKGWRTRVANSIAGIGVLAMPLLEQLGALPWANAFGEKVSLAIAFGIVAMNRYLREITTTPAGQSND